MVKTKPKKKNGRPKIKIDYKLAEKLAYIQCTHEEIAGILEVSLATLEHDKKFLQVFRIKKKTGKSSLRRMQFRRAEEGNPALLIWLGKQYLGQSDKTETQFESQTLADLVKEVAKNGRRK